MSVTAISATSTISLTQGAVAAPSAANSDAQAASNITSNSSTTASAVAAATVAPASASPIDAIAQQIAQYTAILDDSTGAYSIDQQVQAYDAVGTILFGTVVGTGSSAHFEKTTTLSSADVQAAFYAADESKFGLQVQTAYQGISKAELGSDAGGAPSDSQDPNKGLLNGFESLSATDQQIYLDTAGRGAYEGWSSADFENNLQASSNLENYINEATATEKLTSDQIYKGDIADPTLKAAYALQASDNTLGFTDAVNNLLGSPDSANSVSAQAAAAYAAPGSSAEAADASITEGKKALASLTSTPTTVSNASIALTVLQNAAAKAQSAAKTNPDSKSGSAPAGAAQGASASGLTSSGARPYTQGSIASTNA
jgi:hypothetical protein